MSLQREGAAGGLHLVGGINVVFEEDGDAVEMSARRTGGPLRVEGGSEGERCRDSSR